MLFPYLSFSYYLRDNFLEKHGKAVPNHEQLCKLKKDLIEATRRRFVLSVIYLILCVMLVRLDATVGEEIKLLNNCCEKYLELINKKVSQLDNDSGLERIQELYRKKEEIFNSLKEKRFFYKSSLHIFGIFKTPDFKKVSYDIKRFYETLTEDEKD